MKLASKTVGHILPVLGGKITGGAFVGALIALTGFGPEEWFARAFKSVLPDRLGWPIGLDARPAFVALGVAVIVADRLIQRRAVSARVIAQTAQIESLLRPDATPPLPDKPAIAVLPFENLGGDASQDYFANGMVEDIIGCLSRNSGLLVISSSSSFAFKTKQSDTREIGRVLGVGYLVEGNIRKSDDLLRINVRLVEAQTGRQIWSDRYDSPLGDIFALQDRISESVVGALSVEVRKVETDRARRKPTSDLTAYDYYLRSIEIENVPDQATHEEAIRLCRRALELDPTYSSAYGLAAFLAVLPISSNWTADADMAAVRAECAIMARNAVKFGPDDAQALSRAGFALAYVCGEVEEGLGYVDHATTLNPNSAEAWVNAGWVHVYNGDYGVTLECLTRAQRLNPLDPLFYGAAGAASYACIFLGRYDDARALAERSLRLQPKFHSAIRALIAAQVLSGRIEEAKATAQRLLALGGVGRIKGQRTTMPLRNIDDANKLNSTFEVAGLI